jgi:hypothetical protein
MVCFWMKHIQGTSRSQTLLLPACVDDYVGPKERLSIRSRRQGRWIKERSQNDRDATAMAQACQSELASLLATYETDAGVQVPAKVNFFSAYRPV